MHGQQNIKISIHLSARISMAVTEWPSMKCDIADCMKICCEDVEKIGFG